MLPTASDVLTFLGQPPAGAGQNLAPVERALHTATMMVKGYTRGRGFDDMGIPNEDLAAVIVSCAARLYSNPAGSGQEAAGPFQRTPGVFNGWTLAELAILNNYRIRAR